MIQRSKRLIQHEQVRVGSKSASQGYTLLFTARKFRDRSIRKILHADTYERFLYEGIDFTFGSSSHSQPKSDVLHDRAMRKKGVILEHEPKSTFVSGLLGVIFTIPEHLT